MPDLYMAGEPRLCARHNVAYDEATGPRCCVPCAYDALYNLDVHPGAYPGLEAALDDAPESLPGYVAHHRHRRALEAALSRQSRDVAQANPDAAPDALRALALRELFAAGAGLGNPTPAPTPETTTEDTRHAR